MAESRKHRLLKQVALRWLQGAGCCAFACEVRYDFIGIVDVMGLKQNGDVYVIEAKASSGDMRRDAREYAGYGGKYSRLSKLDKYQTSRKVDFIYYIVADGVNTVELPTFIGVLSEAGVVVRRAKRRVRAKTEKARLDSFIKIAKALSWRKYGHVINHEQEQLEFSIDG